MPLLVSVDQYGVPPRRHICGRGCSRRSQLHRRKEHQRPGEELLQHPWRAARLETLWLTFPDYRF